MAEISINTIALQNDIKHFVEVFCEEGAKESMYLIWDFAHKQMEGYYGEYSGRIYTEEMRTNQELELSYHIFNERMGDSYRGGIIFDNSIIYHPNKGKNIDEDYIENMVWNLGYHGHELRGRKGNEKWYPIKGEPDRFDKVRRYARGETVDGMTFPRDAVINTAMKKAKQQRYSILKF